MRSPSGAQVLGSTVSQDDLVSGTLYDGGFESTMTIPEFSETGTWTLQYVDLRDAVPNSVHLDVAAVAALGIVVEIDVAGVGDTTPPELLGLSVSPAGIDLPARRARPT